MTTAHVDGFARDRLPPSDQWPEFRFDGPDLQFPDRLNCAIELLDRWVERGDGERCAVIGTGVCWTYANLQAQSNRIARVLIEDLGLVAGNRVLLLGFNTPMLAACWFAVVKAGGIVVGAMPLLRAKELTYIIQKGDISHALCDARLSGELALARPHCPSLGHVLRFGDDEAPDGLETRATAKPPTFATVMTAADDVALIAFTSGTTGVPKAAMHAHRDVMAACACWPKHVLRASSEDRFIGSPPLAFTFGLGGLLLFPLSIGASSVLIEKATPDTLPAAIAEFRATVCVTAPTLYRAIAIGTSLRPDTLASLRKCVSAGEPLPAATRALWKATTGIEIIDGLGSTELLHIFISHDEAHARPGSTGTVVPGYVACVLDDQLRPVPAGQVGRLAVKGPTGCRYLDDERQRDYVQGGWNLTGDAYLVDNDGYFIHQGRTDDMIISGGYNISGPEVEAALLAHPGVAECGVVGRPDIDRGQIVTAFVVLSPGLTGSDQMAAELQQHVKRTVAPYKYPRVVEFVASLPRTQSGKLQRFRLRQEAAAPGRER